MIEILNKYLDRDIPNGFHQKPLRDLYNEVEADLNNHFDRKSKMDTLLNRDAKVYIKHTKEQLKYINKMRKIVPDKSDVSIFVGNGAKTYMNKSFKNKLVNTNKIDIRTFYPRLIIALYENGDMTNVHEKTLRNLRELVKYKDSTSIRDHKILNLMINYTYGTLSGEEQDIVSTTGYNIVDNIKKKFDNCFYVDCDTFMFVDSYRKRNMTINLTIDEIYDIICEETKGIFIIEKFETQKIYFTDLKKYIVLSDDCEVKGIQVL